MSFSAPNWDTDTAGDDLHEKLFQKGPKILQKQSKTQKKQGHKRLENQKNEKFNERSKIKESSNILTNIKNSKQFDELVNKLDKILSAKEKLSNKNIKGKVDAVKNVSKHLKNKVKRFENPTVSKKLNKVKKDHNRSDLEPLLSKNEKEHNTENEDTKPVNNKKRERRLKKKLKRLQNTKTVLCNNAVKTLEKLKKNKSEIKSLVENEETNKTIIDDTKPISKKKARRLKKKLKRLENSKTNKDKPKPEKKIFGLSVDKLKETLANVSKADSAVKEEKIAERSNASSSSLRERMLQQLKASRFRFINEQIYTSESKDAQELFKSDPEAFSSYHEGYRQQVAKWPLNPLDRIINTIKKMPAKSVVADFGCGEARLAKSVPQKVHSFDLVSTDKCVIACDMAQCPLRKQSVDVAVFCLSLMGTNLKDYLYEANRILKTGGILKIAEVESRFEGVETFITGLERFGFKNIAKDLSHKLFYFLDFKKERNIKHKNKLPIISLHPCLYKKR